MEHLKTKAKIADCNMDKGLDKICLLSSTKSCFQKDFHITTMTILVSLNKPVNIAKFAECFDKENIQKQLSYSRPGNWTHRQKLGFYNCFTMYHVPSNKVAIKLFSNGNLHITGVKNIECALEYASIISDVINNFVVDRKLSQYYITKFNVQLVNGCFKFKTDNMKINLNLLCSKMSQVPMCSCVFNKDHHPGVRIKYSNTLSSKPVTIIIFESGSVLMHAFLNGDDMFNTFQFITSNFDSMSNDVLIPFVEAKKNKKKSSVPFDYAQYL